MISTSDATLFFILAVVLAVLLTRLWMADERDSASADKYLDGWNEGHLDGMEEERDRLLLQLVGIITGQSENQPGWLEPQVLQEIWMLAYLRKQISANQRLAQFLEQEPTAPESSYAAPTPGTSGGYPGPA